MKKPSVTQIIIFLAVLLASCATAPKASFPKEDGNLELSLLPAGGKIYLWADVPQSRPLLDVLSFEGMSGRDAARILDSTASAAATVFESDHSQVGQGRRFFLAATGDYPRFRANFSLAFSKGWKKLKGSGGNRYWYSKNDNIALALGSELALVSDSDPWGIFLGEVPVEIPPQPFMEFRRGMALAGWIPSPSGPINGFLDSLGIPIQIPAESFFFGAARLPGSVPGNAPENANAGPWELVLRIKVPSASHARSLVSLFSMARLFVQRGMLQQGGPWDELFSTGKGSISPQEAAAMLFANSPEQDGEFLTLRISSLDPGRMALLFNMFSVYSNQSRQ